MSPSSAQSRKSYDDDTAGEQIPAAPAKAAGRYDPANRQQLTAILATVYRDLSAGRDNAEVVTFYAGFACELAVFVRAHCGIDLATLAFPVQEEPLNASHPLAVALPAIEIWIEDYFDGLSADAAPFSELDPQEKMQRLATQARMRAACVWKGYLLGLNTPPEQWDSDAVCAMGSLAILSVANAAKVIGTQRAAGKPDFIRDNVRDDEWPPRAFINVYLQNEDMLTARLRAMQRRS